MVRMAPLPDFSSAAMADLAEWIDADTAPPVEQWHPERSGEIDIRIASDGRWFHEGGLITRPALVRLFSRILRREGDGRYVLVTPAERLTITVEDLPFVAVEARVDGAGAARQIAFRLNSGDLVMAGADHPVRFDIAASGEPQPAVLVRGSGAAALWARIARPVYYQLVDCALADGEEQPALRVAGAEFPLQ